MKNKKVILCTTITLGIANIKKCNRDRRQTEREGERDRQRERKRGREITLGIANINSDTTLINTDNNYTIKKNIHNKIYTMTYNTI